MPPKNDSFRVAHFKPLQVAHLYRYNHKTLTKETAKQKFRERYGNVAACTLREVKSVRDTIRYYEDEILNYFDGRKTNASAESLNSKIKCFRAQVKGVMDIPFFMYRLATVLG